MERGRWQARLANGHRAIGVMDAESLRINFWRYLVKEGAEGLPLKQRAPDVAILRGDELEDCYCSNPRGLLQKRGPSESTREALLDRLLANSARLLEGIPGAAGEMGRHTPVAILRRAGGGPDGGVAAHASSDVKVRVVLASELMELLETPTGPLRPADVGPDECWSLQALVPTSRDVRLVASYSRDALDKESIEVTSRSYKAMYPMASLVVGINELEAASSVVPPEQAAAVEAKTLALVRYVQLFHQQRLNGLMVEFVLDSSNRTLLHGFWRVVPAGAADTGFTTATAFDTSTTMGSPRPSGPVSATTASAYDAASRCNSRPASARDPILLDPMASSQSVQIEEDNAEDHDMGDELEEAIERVRAAAAGPQQARRGPHIRGTSTAPASVIRAPKPERPTSARSRLEPSLSPQPELGLDGDDRAARYQAAAAAGAPVEPAWSTRSPGPPQLPVPIGGPRVPRPRPASATARVCSSPDVQQQQAPARAWEVLVGGSPVSASSARSSPTPTALGPAPAATKARPASARASRAAAAAKQQRQPPGAKGGSRGGGGGRGSGGGGSTTRCRSTGELHRTIDPCSRIQGRQFFSRFEKLGECAPRLMCALARQLERYRECSYAWQAQQEAVDVILHEQSQCVSVANKEVDRLVVEREQLDKTYAQKYDALVKGLHREQEKARDSAIAKRKELERSLELERETTQILGEEEAKNRALRCTLDRTVDQLNIVKSEMLQCQAAAEARGLEFTAGTQPRLQMTRQTIERSLQEKEQLRHEAQVTEGEVAIMQAELRRQRAYTARLADFLRRLTSAPQARYLLDAALRRDAQKLLVADDRRRLAAGVDLGDTVVTSGDGVTAVFQMVDRQTLALLRSLDTNRDGKVSAPELAAGMKAGILHTGGGGGLAQSSPPFSSSASPAPSPAPSPRPPPQMTGWMPASGMPVSFGPPGFEAARLAADAAVLSGSRPTAAAY